MDVGLRDARKTLGRSFSNSEGRRTEMAETLFSLPADKTHGNVVQYFPSNFEQIEQACV